MDGSVAPMAPNAVAVRAPVTSIWQHHSTREAAKGAGFDFCRALPMGSHIERPLRAHGDFFGEFEYTATPDGIGFAEIDIDPCVSRFGPGGDDSRVDVGMVNAGTMRIRHGRDETLVLNAGAGPVLFDAARSMTTSTSRIELAYLNLPRAAVVAAIGGAAVPRGMALRPLSPGVLTSQLVACLRGLQREIGRNTPAVNSILHTANALALVILANLRGANHHWPGELDAALYGAACHQLSLHVADPCVTVDAVAATLGCSRAQLYRLFAARGQTVAGYLYELRMQRAAATLHKRPHFSISTVTLLCGYSEPIAFDRAFRRRFGMTPSDWRAESTTFIRA